jgi:hypothetical protein
MTEGAGNTRREAPGRVARPRPASPQAFLEGNP